MNKNKIKLAIEFDSKQYLALIKAVYLGNWMANAHRGGSSKDPHKKDYEGIEDYLFSFAKQFGFGHYVDDDDAKEGKYFPTRQFEEGTDVNMLHKEYDEEIFWDELIDRLGERDFYQQYSKSDIKKMTREERFEKLYEYIDKWADEIDQNGLEKIVVKSIK